MAFDLRTPSYRELGIEPEYTPMWAGESCSVVNDVKPAGEIVRDIARDAEAVLSSE